MRRLFASASLLAATALAAPMAALPSEVAAQQAGLVNISVLDDGAEVLSRNNVTVNVAANVVASLCDLIDVNQAQVLVFQALQAGKQTSDCGDVNNDGDIDQVVIQAAGGDKRRGGRP